MHLFAIFSLVIGVIEAEVELVQVLFRHGDRAPSFTYPADTHLVESDFPRGFSQLTQKGYEQAQELGEYLRYRYSQHFPLIDKYHRKEVLVRSSDKDRCIETAMGVASAMFPGDVVPVHTYANHWTDLLLKPNSVKCSKVERMIKADKKQLRAGLDVKYRNLFALLTEKTGWNVDASNIEDVYNVIYRKYSNGIPQPSWVFSDYGSENHTVFDAVLELKRQSRLESFNSDEKSRLRTGYLLGQIQKNMDDRIKMVSQRKVVLYASHDATVTSLHYSIQTSNELLPPYAAAVIFELHNIEGSRFVKVLYRNSTTSEPHELYLPGCGGNSHCTWEQFQLAIEGRTIKSFEEHNSICENDVDHISQNVFETFKVLYDYLLTPIVVSHITYFLYYYLSSVSKEYLH